jgi:hypothetical protein
MLDPEIGDKIVELKYEQQQLTANLNLFGRILTDLSAQPAHVQSDNTGQLGAWQCT